MCYFFLRCLDGRQLVFGDSHSFLNVNPNWTPPYDSLGDKFELQDILNYAGVPLTDKEFAAPE